MDRDRSPALRAFEPDVDVVEAELDAMRAERAQAERGLGKFPVNDRHPRDVYALRAALLTTPEARRFLIVGGA